MKKRYTFQKRHILWLGRKLAEADIDEPAFNVVIWTLAQGLKPENPAFDEKEFYVECRLSRQARLANVRSAAA